MQASKEKFNIVRVKTLDDSQYVYNESYETANPDAPVIPGKDLEQDTIFEFFERRKEDTYICLMGKKRIGFITLSSYRDGLNLGIHLAPNFRGRRLSHHLLHKFINTKVPKSTSVYAATFEQNKSALGLIKKMGGVMIGAKVVPSRGKWQNSIKYLIFKIDPAKS